MAGLAHIPLAQGGSGNFLVTPNVGLMIWTLLLFGISMYVLAKLAFPRITEALDRRQKMIEESIDSGTSVMPWTNWIARASIAGSSASGMPA